MDLVQSVTVKLGVENEKGITLFRRVDLSRHITTEGNGNRFYRILKLYAIQSATGSHDIPREDVLSEYRVTLHFTDPDGDEIMIGSPGELKYALSLFKTVGMIKILADVTKVDTASNTAGSHTIPEEVSMSRASAATQTVEGAIPNLDAPASQPVPLQNVIRSILGALGPAIMTVDASVRAAHQHAVNENKAAAEGAVNEEIKMEVETKDLMKESTPNAAAAAPVAVLETPHVKDAPVDDAKVQAVPKAGTEPIAPKSTSNVKPDAAQSETAAPPMRTVTFETKTAPVNTSTTQGGNGDDRPFIHGRHTCDGCLNTPIVGKRFHAVNLPDYDLCEACKNNYTGTEITFVEAELERDRAFQDRWWYRRAKWSRGLSVHTRACRGPTGRHRNWNPHPNRLPGFGPVAAGPSPDQVDGALKEAIRRSLADLKKKEMEEAKIETKSEDKVENNSVKDEPSQVESATKVEAEPSIATAESNEKNTETSEVQSATLQAVCVETVTEEPAPAVDSTADKSVQVEPEILFPTAPVEAAKPEPEIIIPPPEEEVILPRYRFATPEVISGQVEAPSSPASEPSTFGIEADGMGSVAAALGDTLDKVATAIDDLNVELNRSSPTVTKNEAVTTILDEDEISQGSGWSVVPEEFANDEALARAAHVIGSALFNSDMAHSTEDVSGSHGAENENAKSESSAGSISTVDSVPTTVRSVVVMEAQSQRWATQLEKFHEIGFSNDALLIETLERLQAANIGVDSTDEVTVQQVLDELMKDW